MIENNDSNNTEKEKNIAANIKTVVFYHADCMDGLFSMLVARKYITENKATTPECIPVGYNEQNNVADIALEGEYDEVYILDFSVKPADIGRLIEAHKKVTMLDHHKSSFEAYRGVSINGIVAEMVSHQVIYFIDIITGSEVTINKTCCAATLTWAHFYPYEPVPMILKYISDYDLWKFKLEHTKAIHYALLAKKDSHRLLTAQLNNETFEYNSTDILSEGYAILSYREHLLKGAVESAAIGRTTNTDIRKNTGIEYIGVIMGLQDKSLINDAAEVFIKEYNIPVMFVHTSGIPDLKLSFRSNDELPDVSKLAKYYKGGGHRNSAGGFIATYELAINFELLNINTLKTFERCKETLKEESMEAITKTETNKAEEPKDGR